MANIDVNTCSECGSYNTHYCKPCNSVHFRDKFSLWTSNDSNVDKLIQNSQLDAISRLRLIEWIEYSNFTNIEFVAHGGFGDVYKAIWKDGPICEGHEMPVWNINKSEWNRDSEKRVAIKKFRNITNASSEFLNEVKNNLRLNHLYVNYIYGITRDIQSGEYAIVTEFQSGGNLRELIKKNYSILNWKLIIKILNEISLGLTAIHNSDYCHKDFHSGNILNSIHGDTINLFISDFGMCCAAELPEQLSADKTLYGVLSFVAPEILRGEKFTKAADIYGFGMLMSEIISGEAPFVNRDYDVHLALDICKGKRPLIPEYTPDPYAALMKRCWDPVPSNRPTARELFSQFNDLQDEQGIEKEFSQEQEDKWKAQLAELAINPRPMKKSHNFLTSKRLDYSKQISQLLENKDDEVKKNDEIYHTRQYDMSI
ncbi:kinase-like domain-containing protein [Rhizophagus clarus]|nr:kinase-like domain-containing protein [Rhizophagus clarus]